MAACWVGYKVQYSVYERGGISQDQGKVSEGPWYGVCVCVSVCVGVMFFSVSMSVYMHVYSRVQITATVSQAQCHRLTWTLPKHGASGCCGAVARAYICEPSGSRVLGPPSPPVPGTERRT